MTFILGCLDVRSTRCSNLDICVSESGPLKLSQEYLHISLGEDFQNNQDKKQDFFARSIKYYHYVNMLYVNEIWVTDSTPQQVASRVEFPFYP